ncbi:MAG: CIA30 family protein, partial [Verrucomicrobiales bacterium]
MIPLKSLFTTAVACVATINLASVPSWAASLTEFNSEDNDRLGWGVVADGVMGGLSKGKVAFTDKNTLLFSG